MRSQRETIAKSVAGKLFAAEEAIDIAAARIAELNAALPIARLDARFAAAIGQDALVSSASAVMLIAQTRQEIVATHANLKQTNDDVGLAEVGYGDLFKAQHRERPSDGRYLRAA
ncbi:MULTISPECIES: hypothetical protein [Sphingobium]|uniref:hypothetical protein n=1 Tax=Sphingobium TaxID=165695 RepID=UPI00123BE2AA|nr:hypothetical protein [Sphingobium estronivorans]